MNILSFGEVLWDVFPDKSVIGGAPFNFSAHIARLGAKVDFATAVGKDDLGIMAMACVKDKGVSGKLVGLSSYPTGACFVTVDEQGVPSYELRYNMAYDHIVLSKEQWSVLVRTSYHAFYFGTLSLRHEESRNTLLEILSRCSFEQVLFDVNIRQSWYNHELIEDGLRACTILKVSREESGVFEKAGLVSLSKVNFDRDEEYYLALCRALASGYDIATVLLTLDKDGAMVYDAVRDTVCFSEKPKGKVVSTVGAGDSFSACYLYQFLKGNSTNKCLHKAIVLSDFVVQHTEAIPEYTCELLNEILS